MTAGDAFAGGVQKMPKWPHIITLLVAGLALAACAEPEAETPPLRPTVIEILPPDGTCFMLLASRLCITCSM